MAIAKVAKSTFSRLSILLFAQREERRAAWVTFRTCAWLFIQPCLIALTISAVWYMANWKLGWHFKPNSQETIMTATIPTVSSFFGFMAALILTSIWERSRKIRNCLRTGDKATFLSHRDERMPLVMHTVLCMLSLPVMGLFFFLHQEDVISGAAQIFSIALGIAVFWVAGIELENPIENRWLGLEIPNDWLEEDSVTFFASVRDPHEPKPVLKDVA